MFCNHCGGTLQGSQNFCPNCGRPVVASAPPAPTARWRVARHLGTLAIFWLVISAFRLLSSGGVFFAGRFIRRAVFHDPFAAHFIPRLFPMLGGFLFLSALIGFLCGWGLLQKQSWARTLGIVLAAFSLLDPPFGTALGIYTLWVLLPAQSEQEFSILATAPNRDR